jgi:hypothetical protein
MSDYQKGRYDELVERYKELLEMYKSLQCQATVSTPRSGISRAQVSNYAGVKIDPGIIWVTIGGASIIFAVLARYFLGFTPSTFALTIAAFGFLYDLLSHGLLYGLLSHVRRKLEEKKSQPPA